MNEAPKKIWANAIEIEGWEKKPDFGEPFQYIRADLVDELVGALEHIEEYWNRDQNEQAMADALWHIIDTAHSALEKMKEEI